MRSVRVRLTAWYAATLALVLLAYAVGVFLFLRHALTNTLAPPHAPSLVRSEEYIQHELRELATVLALARRALAPVDRMRERAAQITAERLTERLPVDGEDELGRLASTFNELLARLEGSFEQTRRFTADASHELARRSRRSEASARWPSASAATSTPIAR
jgi:methyl-accepting chemotaxis protein